MTISKNAEHLLRKISRIDSFPSDKIKESAVSAIDALLEHDYIAGEISSINTDNGEFSYAFYSITESGRAYLDSRNSDTIRFWIPLVLSSVSLIVSIASIFLSPYFSAFFSNLYGL